MGSEMCIRDSSWSRDLPQPGSLFQRLREAEKRDPGNEVGSLLGFSYGVCQLATMGFFTLMKGSARNIVHFLMFIDTLRSFSLIFYCFYSVTHRFPIFRFIQINALHSSSKAKHINGEEFFFSLPNSQPLRRLTEHVRV